MGGRVVEENFQHHSTISGRPQHLRQTTATQKKTQQKRMKVEKDVMSFEQHSKENEERICLQVLQCYGKQSSSNSIQILQASTVDNSIPPSLNT